MDKLLIILGPTSTGKTDLGMSLAKKINGEIISCDSRQVYTGLDIGTGKLPSEEVLVQKSKGSWDLDGVKVWLYDLVDPKLQQFTVKDYIEIAEKKIEDIFNRGKIPIIVGGSGLYLKGLLEGIPNLEIPLDKKLRKKLDKLSLKELQIKLQSLSVKVWEKLNSSDRQNSRRLFRAIELVMMNPYAQEIQNSKLKSENYQILKIGLKAPREILNQRIDLRVLSRISQGMVKEAKNLYKKGLTFKRMKQLGLEYGVLADYLRGHINKEELIKRLKLKIHQYAKRQMTWFKKEKDVSWFDISEPGFVNNVERLVIDWYNKVYEQS